jgi:hypothetical protein
MGNIQKIKKQIWKFSNLGEMGNIQKIKKKNLTFCNPGEMGNIQKIKNKIWKFCNPGEMGKTGVTVHIISCFLYWVIDLHFDCNVLATAN